MKKFQDRKKAIARVWAAIQSLAANGASEKPEVAKPEPSRKSAKPAKKAKAAKKGSGKPNGDKASDRSNKKAEVIEMMKRAKGATLAEMAKRDVKITESHSIEEAEARHNFKRRQTRK